MRRCLLALLCVLLVCPIGANAQNKKKVKQVSGFAANVYGMDMKHLSKVDGVIEKAIADRQIPGAVLAVVRMDNIVYEKAYGNKSVVPDTVAMTPETVFDLASVSKCVGTTLSFMQLIDNGEVRLTDNVSRYIPGFKPWVDPQSGDTVDITIRDLMTHSSGLAPYIDVQSFVQKYGPSQPDSLMSVIARDVKRNFRPGTKFLYSCLNFITLQHILENVSGMKLCDYAQKNVFDRLGLKHTCYNPSGETLTLCAPTAVQADGKPLLGKVHDPIARIINNGNSGNAGVFSNAEDLSKIAMTLMNGGIFPSIFSNNSNRILSEAAVKTMITVPLENDPSVGRALGWDVSSEHSGVKGDLFSRTQAICHTGYTGPSIVIDFETHTAVILLCHRVHPRDEGSVGRLRATVANIVAGSILSPSRFKEVNGVNSNYLSDND